MVLSDKSFQILSKVFDEIKEDGIDVWHGNVELILEILLDNNEYSESIINEVRNYLYNHNFLEYISLITEDNIEYHYSDDEDILNLKIIDKTLKYEVTEEIGSDILIDFSNTGKVMNIEILYASETLEVSKEALKKYSSGIVCDILYHKDFTNINFALFYTLPDMEAPFMRQDWIKVVRNNPDELIGVKYIHRLK